MKTKESPPPDNIPPSKSVEALEKIVNILVDLPDKEKIRVLWTVCVWCDFRTPQSY